MSICVVLFIPPIVVHSFCVSNSPSKLWSRPSINQCIQKALERKCERLKVTCTHVKSGEQKGLNLQIRRWWHKQPRPSVVSTCMPVRFRNFEPWICHWALVMILFGALGMYDSRHVSINCWSLKNKSSIIGTHLVEKIVTCSCNWQWLYEAFSSFIGWRLVVCAGVLHLYKGHSRMQNYHTWPRHSNMYTLYIFFFKRFDQVLTLMMITV